MTDDTWFVILTAPQMEFRSAQELRERGYTVYVPPRKTWATRRSGSRHAKVHPLYPGYIFVYRLVPWSEMNPRHLSFLKHRKTGKGLLRGVLTVKNALGDQEAFGIPEEVVGKIALQCFEMECDLNKPERQFEEGDVCIISGGPGEGKEGRITKLKKGDAAFDIIGAARSVTVKLKNLRLKEAA
jgi:transcription antitermination factor NusG